MKRLFFVALAFSLLCVLPTYVEAADDLFADINPPAPTPGSTGSSATTATTPTTPVVTTPAPAPYPTAQTPPAISTPPAPVTPTAPNNSSVPTGGSGGSNSAPTQTQTAPTQTTTTTTTPPATIPVAQNEPEPTPPAVEEPAAATQENNLLLYSLLGVIGVLTILVGALVVGVMRKHELPATTAALLREEAPYMQHDDNLAPLSVEPKQEAPHGPPLNDLRPTQQPFVHRPSIDEARTFIQMLRDRGYSDAQIRDHFNSHGWNDEQVAVAMRRN